VYQRNVAVCGLEYINSNRHNGGKNPTRFLAHDFVTSIELSAVSAVTFVDESVPENL
jgi:hypothetical protein